MTDHAGEELMGWRPYSRTTALASVGPGWSAPVTQVMDAAEQLGVSVDQVKEKFGALRIYIGRHSGHAAGGAGAYDAVAAVIRSAEADSVRTCEACGAIGRMWGVTREEMEQLPRPWRKTLCASCAFQVLP